MITGSTYLERGEPVTVVAAWNGKKPEPGLLPLVTTRPDGPRNVMLRRADGVLVVRPFRGLRRPAAGTSAP